MNIFKGTDLKNKIYIGLFLLTFTIAFISKINTTLMDYKIQMYIAIFWVCIAIFDFLITKNPIKKKLLFFLAIFIIPRIIIHLYSILLVLIGYTESVYIGTNITAYAPVLAVISIIYIFREKALTLSMIALISSFLVSACYGIFMQGPMVIVDTLSNIILGTTSTLENIFEMHDHTFACGIVLLYLILKEKKNVKLIVIFSFIIFIGWKRIQILAMIVVLLLMPIFKRIKPNTVIMLTYLCILFSSLVFVGVIDTGFLTTVVSHFGINTMGRTYYYEFLAQFFDFSILEFGLGRGATKVLLVSKGIYLNVQGVHSDILKYFAEIGFLGFVSWITYNYYYLPNKILKKINYKIFYQFLILSIYMFVLYLTDNVDTYFITQFFYLLVPIYSACFIYPKTSNETQVSSELTDIEN